jgi:hypothetical protein
VIIKIKASLQKEKNSTGAGHLTRPAASTCEPAPQGHAYASGYAKTNNQHDKARAERRFAAGVPARRGGAAQRRMSERQASGRKPANDSERALHLAKIKNTFKITITPPPTRRHRERKRGERNARLRQKKDEKKKKNRKKNKLTQKK